ncbi:hypothetical protein B0T24DRAFT_261357 [Lasiosphaeria ovina]|uniref:NmrA-like domain-containing protein n=1 Tax=Lasiosphaeria ovina TaxID=92902 RepID=A0AAE0N7C7_9PEZI|nr:hypothetical protein B0T24DRAFT_261357 [Lasiosphaeria ovina]
MRQPAAQPSMMRIAIAGGGGLAYVLAGQITLGANAVLVISQHAHPEFEQDFPGCQVAQVDFSNVDELRYTLLGVDLLISTISGSQQLDLIDAARQARVRLFVPSEFEGDVEHRPADDPLDRHSHAARDLLDHWAQSTTNNMRYTIFSCGIFMERFAPGGLEQYRMGAGSGLQTPNDYLINVGEATGEIVEGAASGRPARVSLTSVYDLARFVAAAIEVGPANWPREYRIRGDSLTVRDILATCEAVRGIPFSAVSRSYQDVEAEVVQCEQAQYLSRWYYLQRLLQTANERYHIRRPNLVEDVNRTEATRIAPPTRFRRWLEHVWGPAV